MKFFAIISLLMTFSTTSFACFDQAFALYNEEMSSRRHQDIHVYHEAVRLKAGDVHDMYRVKFFYDEDVLIYEGSSEFMSGYGVEAIVMEPTSCKFIEMVQVYVE